jgi:hypothetical protein
MMFGRRPSKLSSRGFSGLVGGLVDELDAYDQEP